MKTFLQKIYHDAPKDAVLPKVKSSQPSDDSSSIFITSLNEEKRPKQPKRKHPDFYSDNSDEEDTAFPVHKKKNRPGQRARRELWEKQYGENAKHVKKLKEERPKKLVPKQMAQTERKPMKTTESVKDLHPSWAAKLQQKQKLTAAIAETSRIVFED